MSKTQTVSEALEATLSDQRLSRGERKTLRAVLAELDLSSADHAALRKKAFTLAAAAVEDGQGGAAAVIDWLEDVVKVLVGDLTGTATGATPSAVPGNEAHFSPGDTCRDRIIGLFRTARTSADVCVFTITDNTIARAIVDAHRRGVKVRIISDNDKAFDRGSDVMDLDDAGIDVRIDNTSSHMHHKFAIFDGRTVLTGSYNWTRSAASENQENLVLLGDPAIRSAFQAEFDRLWAQFS